VKGNGSESVSQILGPFSERNKGITELTNAFLQEYSMCRIAIRNINKKKKKRFRFVKRIEEPPTINDVIFFFFSFD
jgi:hypothetical protein